VLTAVACYENQEGCLDILAENYDVTADTECLDCCTYPDLVLSLTQVNGDTTFSLGDTIVNDLGQQTVIIDMVYFLSGFEIEIDGEAKSVADSMLVDNEMDTLAITDDAIAVSRTRGSYIVGELRDRGRITEISFDIGIPSEVNGNTLIVESSNDLTANADTLRNIDNTYSIQRLVLGTGSDLTDTITIEVDASYGGALVVVEIDTTFALGTDKRIPLTVDYSTWFDGIDFTTSTAEEQQQALVSNLSQGFSY